MSRATSRDLKRSRPALVKGRRAGLGGTARTLGHTMLIWFALTASVAALTTIAARSTRVIPIRVRSRRNARVVDGD